MLNPLVELYHQMRGTISAGHRAVGERLREATVPRPTPLALEVAALLVPWWGFFAYFVVYAMTVMALVAVFVGPAFVGSWLQRAGYFKTYDELVFFWPAFAVTAPITALPFRAWVRRRRGEVLDLATRGTFREATTRAGKTLYTNGRASMTDFSLRDTEGTAWRGSIGLQPDWTAPGTTVEVVVLPGANRAILRSPDGGLCPIWRA